MKLTFSNDEADKALTCLLSLGEDIENVKIKLDKKGVMYSDDADLKAKIKNHVK